MSTIYYKQTSEEEEVKQQQQEQFNKSILNAPKQKLKIPIIFPDPFVLEEEEENTYIKFKSDSLSSIEDEKESSDNEEFVEYNEILTKNNNKAESFDEENGKILFSLLKNNYRNYSTDSKDDTDISGSQKEVEEED